MQALVFDRELKLIDLPKPFSKDEALIKVTLAGICNTDLEIVKGYMGFSGILGHEFVGIVEEAPDPAFIGKRVVGEINAGCGVCPLCIAGDPRHCANRSTLGIFKRPGVFAEYTTLPVENLFVLPDRMTDDLAVFTEPIAAACEIVEQVDVAEKDLLVVGDGKLAQLIARVLPHFDANCTVLGKHPEKLELIPDICKTVTLGDFKPSADYDIVVEASGHPDGFFTALESVRPRGTFVLKSTYAQDLTFNPAKIVIDEISVVGSRCGRFGPALSLMEQGKIDPTPLITGRFPLSQALEAFRRAGESDSIKTLIEIG